jgi:hypothetical protein
MRRRLAGVQIQPDSGATESGSRSTPDRDDADQREVRERDLVRELDQMTGRRAEGESEEPDPRPLNPKPARAQRSPAEEVLDE